MNTEPEPGSHLRRAAIAGDSETVRALLNAGVWVNDTCERGFTAAMLAAFHGRTETLRLLLERGADVHRRNVFGATALFHAAKGGHLEAVRVLLDASADVNERYTGRYVEGSTPAIVAYRHPAVVAFLLERNADWTITSDFGTSILGNALLMNHTATAQWLADRGAILSESVANQRKLLTVFLADGDEQKAQIAVRVAPLVFQEGAEDGKIAV